MINLSVRFFSWLLKIMGANCVYVVAVKSPPVGQEWDEVNAISYQRIRCKVGFAKKFWHRVEEDVQDQRVSVEIFEIVE